MAPSLGLGRETPKKNVRSEEPLSAEEIGRSPHDHIRCQAILVLTPHNIYFVGWSPWQPLVKPSCQKVTRYVHKQSDFLQFYHESCMRHTKVAGLKSHHQIADVNAFHFSQLIGMFVPSICSRSLRLVISYPSLNLPLETFHK